MEIRAPGFGSVEIEGTVYDHDVVIDAGRVRGRRREPSESLRDQYGHTPLSARENLPWGDKQLVIGTGYYGSLPVAPEVYEEAERRGVGVLAVPTPDACRRLQGLDASDIHAVLHVTC